MAVLYTVTDSAGFINIDGISGTSKANESYSLQKSNIAKFTKDVLNNGIGIVMVDDTDYTFDYRTLVNPATGLAYTSLNICEASLEGFTNASASTYTSNLISNKITLALIAVQLTSSATSGWITIKSDIVNTVNVAIGESTVALGSAYELAPGESVTIEHSDLSKIYAISGTTGQIIHILGSTR